MDSNVNSAQGPQLPERIKRLSELANDLWWTWNTRAREVFRKLDYTLWRQTAHNPVRMLQQISAEMLALAAKDERFLAIYDAGDRRAGRGAQRPRHLVAPHVSRQPGPHRLLLRRVRAAPVAADLRRRPRRAGGRSLQGGQRSRHPADRRRLHVSAGLLPPDDLAGRLAAGGLRAPQLDRRSRRAGHSSRRQALHRRRSTRQPQRPGVGVEGAARARETVPARHRPRGERAVGPRAVGAALRRRPGDAHPAGDHPRHRRRPRAEGARTAAGGLAPQRRPRRLRRAAAHPRPDRTGSVVRSGAPGRAPDDDVHDAHARGRGPRRVSRSTWSRRISPARGARSAAIAISSWRSGTTTTAAGRCST